MLLHISLSLDMFSFLSVSHLRRELLGYVVFIHQGFCMAVSFFLGFNCLVFSQRQEDSMCVCGTFSNTVIAAAQMSLWLLSSSPCVKWSLDFSNPPWETMNLSASLGLGCFGRE